MKWKGKEGLVVWSFGKCLVFLMHMPMKSAFIHAFSIGLHPLFHCRLPVNYWWFPISRHNLHLYPSTSALTLHSDIRWPLHIINPWTLVLLLLIISYRTMGHYRCYWNIPYQNGCSKRFITHERLGWAIFFFLRACPNTPFVSVMRPSWRQRNRVETLYFPEYQTTPSTPVTPDSK